MSYYEFVLCVSIVSILYVSLSSNNIQTFLFLITETYPCGKGYKKCADKIQCLHEELFCDGYSFGCKDNSDELQCGKLRD